MNICQSGSNHRYEAELVQAREDAQQTQIDVQESKAKYRTLAAELEGRVVSRSGQSATFSVYLPA